MMYGTWGWGWGGALLMGLVCIAFIVLLIWGIVRLTNHNNSTTNTTKQMPIDIAKERYAKGEITKDQYDHIKKDLS